MTRLSVLGFRPSSAEKAQIDRLAAELSVSPHQAVRVLVRGGLAKRDSPPRSLEHPIEGAQAVVESPQSEGIRSLAMVSAEALPDELAIWAALAGGGRFDDIGQCSDVPEL